LARESIGIYRVSFPKEFHFDTLFRTAITGVTVYFDGVYEDPSRYCGTGVLIQIAGVTTSAVYISVTTT